MSNHSKAAARTPGVDAGRHKIGGARPAARLLSLVLLLPLGACGLNKVAMAPEVPYDYRERHPIVLAEAPHVIDIFPPAFGSRLDQENVLRIREFVTRYRRMGRGMITVLAPTGGAD
ncbi:MAG: CpaD family pilus assembly lipoprotein, partial [Methylocystis sp.]